VTPMQTSTDLVKAQVHDGMVSSAGLTDADMEMFRRSWIPHKLVAQAKVRRVHNFEGAEILNRKPADYAGLVFPYFRPGTPHSHLERLRVDRPPIEERTGRPAFKYLTAAGSRNSLYFVPGTPPEQLRNCSLQIVLTEGEKKGLALYRASWESLPESSDAPRFLPIALSGVNSWRGTTGRAQNEKGEWLQMKGPIPDLDILAWQDRRVTILFDSNANSNRNVHYARLHLADELKGRGASVYIADIPDEVGINGIDDFLATHGLPAALGLIAAARTFKPNDKLAALDYTDAGNEQAFELMFGDDFLFNRTSVSWMRWSGNLWEVDTLGHADRSILQVADSRLHAIFQIVEDESEYKKSGDPRKTKKRAFSEALKLRNVRGRQSTLLSATTNPRFARRAEHFDKDEYLFGCGNGVIDLRTGKFRPGRREDMMTLRTSVPWIEGATCTRWTKFLSEVFPDRPEMIVYWKRIAGYCMTAVTKEECFWILHGSGRNGKGTLIRVLSQVFGDYGGTCEFSTLVADRNRGKSPRNDLAALAGKRFVTAQEGPEGCQLDESLIKSLTGGDLITARFLHKEFFTFYPTWKILLATNHKPEIRGTDTGIWSRPRLIPFTVSFEGHENRNLKHELLEPSELAGILRWATEGCVEYLEQGLDAPTEVVEATREYRDESDVISRFLAEWCVFRPGAIVQSDVLYRGFVKWAEQCGERETMTQTKFSCRLKARSDIEWKHSKNGNFFHGICLQPYRHALDEEDRTRR
jgi:putative DNA primase/helicase